MSKFTDWWNMLFRSKKIVLLGPKGSGKTQFLCSLGAVDNFNNKLQPGVESSGEVFKSIILPINGKKVYINRGHDEKGASFQNRYKDALKKADIVFYVFDLSKYLNNKSLISDNGSSELYRDWVHSHLERIKKHTPQKHLYKLAILMTHTDVCSQKDKNKLIDEFKTCAGQDYASLSNVLKTLDARDEIQCKEIFKHYI